MEAHLAALLLLASSGIERGGGMVEWGMLGLQQRRVQERAKAWVVVKQVAQAVAALAHCLHNCRRQQSK
jgi:hypothetical protein